MSLFRAKLVIGLLAASFLISVFHFKVSLKPAATQENYIVLGFRSKPVTVQILCIGTGRSQQTVQTKIRLLLKKQSDQGLRCLPFHQHLLDALMQCFIKLFYS